MNYSNQLQAAYLNQRHDYLKDFQTLEYAIKFVRAIELNGAENLIAPGALRIESDRGSDHCVSIVWHDYWLRKAACMSITRKVNLAKNGPVFNCAGATWNNWRACGWKYPDTYYGIDSNGSQGESLDQFKAWMRDNLRINQLSPVPHDFGTLVYPDEVQSLAYTNKSFEKLLLEEKRESLYTPLFYWKTATHISYLEPAQNPLNGVVSVSLPGPVLLRWENPAGETLLVWNCEDGDPRDLSGWGWTWVVYRTDDPTNIIDEAKPSGTSRDLQELLYGRFKKAAGQIR